MFELSPYHRFLVKRLETAASASSSEDRFCQAACLRDVVSIDATMIATENADALEYNRRAFISGTIYVGKRSSSERALPIWTHDTLQEQRRRDQTEVLARSQ